MTCMLSKDDLFPSFHEVKEQNTEDGCAQLVFLSCPSLENQVHTTLERISQFSNRCNQPNKIWGDMKREGNHFCFSRVYMGNVCFPENNPCLSVTPGCPFLGSGSVVFPGKHSLGHLRLGLLIKATETSWEKQSSYHASATLHHFLCKFTEANRNLQDTQWNNTLVAKHETCFYHGSSFSMIGDQF